MWHLAQRGLLVTTALVLLIADVWWLVIRSDPTGRVTLTIGLDTGSLVLVGQRLVPSVDGPPLSDPQLVQQITLNPSGDGWIKDGHAIASVRPLLGRVQALPVQYMAVDLADRTSFGRALQALRLLMREGICEATIFERNSAQSGPNAPQTFPIFQLKSFVESDGNLHVCGARYP